VGTPQSKLVLEDLDDGLLTIVMNRPDRRNALNPELCGLLVEALARAAQSSEVRAVLLKGAGGTFCVGGDVKAMAQADAPDLGVDERIRQLRARMEASRLLPGCRAAGRPLISSQGSGRPRRWSRRLHR